MMSIKHPVGTVFVAAALTLAVGSAVANQTVTATAELPAFWQGLDLNGDRQITRDEMRLSAQERFRQADMNGDGIITREEWIESAGFRADPESLARSFDTMDVDQSGAIERDEIRQPRQNAGLFDRMDRDQSGSLTSEELSANRY